MDGSINFNTDVQLNQFQTDFFKNMNEFRNNGLFCDVMLNVNGTSFLCHRLVLTLASPYFRAMFNGDFKESKLDVVTINEIETDIMDLILNAVYSASLQLSPENVYYVLKASHFLQISSIVNVCVPCIIKNAHNVCYLIEICLFAKSFDLKILHDVCVQAIANEILRWGHTEAIKLLPFDVFSSILSKGNFTSIGDKVLFIIIKWSKYNNATTIEIQRLLELTHFQNPIIGPSIIAELISSMDESSALMKNANGKDATQLCSTPNFNVYLKVIDDKSGAVGCGLLKLGDHSEFNQLPTLYNFHAVSYCVSRICLVETKVYYLESDYHAKKYNFFCWVNSENSVKVELKIPDNLQWRNKRFDIVSMGKIIYFVSKVKSSDIWGYDIQNGSNGTWCKMFVQQHRDLRRLGNEFSALDQYSSWLAVTSLNNTLCVIGAKRDISRFILLFDSQNPTFRKVIPFPDAFDFEYADACTFDGKIAISGSMYGGISRTAFYIYDTITNKWSTDIKPMNHGQVNRKLIHRDGFIYALGSDPTAVNEKYDVKLNTWTDIPPLSRRLLVQNNEDVTVSNRSVLYVDVDCSQLDRFSLG